MKYEFFFTVSARKDVDTLDIVIKARLKKKLEMIVVCGNIMTHAKKLENNKVGDYRIRVGDYRLLFDLAGNKITVLRVRHRREAYQDR